MAYENHLPPLSTINQGTRDFDFIPLTELKEFDEKLNEIVKKISSVNTSDASDVNSIAYKLKEIEYNLADAIEFDADGNVVGLNSTTSDKFGDDNGSGNTVIPDQGLASIDNLITNLEKYYNEFVKYLGNDVESDQWKNELQNIFLNLKTSLDNKISSIFGNSAQASILEEKENDETDFMKQDSVKLNNDEIMRLNPNVSNCTRNINLMFEQPGTELIAFEVECPEPDNMIFNMKLQNGDLYYNFNIILDNGKFHITKEEHFKLCDYGIKINIYKYITASNVWRYVFTLTSDSEDVSKVYNFELSGVFVGKFIFDTNAAFPTDHGNYWAFHAVDMVETNGKVDPDKTYYVKSIDDYDDDRNTETNIVYTIVNTNETPTPVAGEVYYVKSVDETDTTVYREYNGLVEFEPDVIYYTKHVETTTDNSNKVITYLECTDLKEFEPGKEYFTKETEFIFIDKLEIKDDEYSDGEVDDLTVDHKGEKLVDENFRKVVKDKKYTNKTVKMMNIDIDSSELLSSRKYEERVANVANKNIVHLDDGVKFTKSSVPGLLVKSRDGARKINNSLNIGFGAKVIELKTIRPHSYEVIGIPCVKQEDILPVTVETESKTDAIDDTEFNYTVGSFSVADHFIEFFSSELNIKDLYDNDILPDAIKFDNVSLLDFKDIMQNVSNFISNIKLVPVGCVGSSMFDFMVVCDGIEDYDTCYHICINLKDEEIAIPVMRKVLNDGNEQNIPLTLQDKITQTISCKNKSYIFTENNDCYESSNGKVWYKKVFKFDKRFYEEIDTDKLKVLGLVKNEYYDELYAIIIDANIEDETKIPLTKLLYAKLDNAGDYLTFDDCSETMIKGWTQTFSYNHNEYLASNTYIVNDSYFGIFFNKDVIRIYVVNNENIDEGYYLNYNIKTKQCLRFSQTTFKVIKLARNKNNKFNGVSIIDEENNKIYLFCTPNDGSINFSYQICDLETLSSGAGGNADYTIHPAYFKDSRSLFIVDKRFVTIACKNDRLNGGADNPYEGYFIYIDTSDAGGAYYTPDESSTELAPISVFSNIQVYNVSYCGDTNNKIAFAFTSNGLYINLTSDPNNFVHVDTDLTFDEDSIAIFSNSTDLANLTWVICGVEGIRYTHDGTTYSACEKVGVDSIRNIGDIDSGYLIGRTALDSIINDIEDGIFVRNIYDKNRNLYYKKVGDYIVAYGNGNSQTYIIDWVSGDKKTYNVAITDLFDIDGEIFAFTNGLENVTIYKFINIDTGFVDVTSEYSQSFTKPVNITSIKQDIEGNIFVIGTQIENNNGVIYYGETLDSLRNVLTLSEDGVIDCFYIYDNEIIISTYEHYAETKHYAWDPKAKTFKFEDVNNINLIYSFRRCFAYNGELYVMNGSGSNPSIVEKGFAKITKDISNTEHNGFYDIDVITPITDDFQIKHDNYLFNYANTLFGIFTTTEYDDNDEIVSKKFHIYVYYETAKRFIEVNNDIAPLLTAIVNMGNSELEECFANKSIVNNYTVAIQETYDESKTPIRNYKPDNEDEDYQTDKIYFDKENSGIIISNYASETNRFNMKSRMAAIGVTGKTHKAQLAMVLGKDNLLGLFDKSMNVIKTFNLKYEVMVGNGSITYIDVDDRFVTQNIFVASDADSNYVFISLRGKFPILSISESGSVVESDSDTVSYGLFKAKIDDIFNNGTDYAVISQEEFGINEFTPTEDINTFIVNNYGYDVANDMILNVFNDRQLIGIVKGFMYDNIESIVFWNTEAMCLDILSPLDWNINIDDIDAQYNRNNTFRDYSVAIDTVNNKAYQTYLDDNNDIVKNEVTFTTIPNEMVRVGCKTYIADDFLKAVKDVTFKDTNERVASAAINLESTRSEYETVQGIYNTAVTAEESALTELENANEAYNESIADLEEAISNSNASTLEALRATLTEKTNIRMAAETNLSVATNNLNNISVDDPNYNSVLETKEEAQTAYETAVAEEAAAQEAYDAELANTDSTTIESLNTAVDVAKRRYQSALTAYNNAKNNTVTAKINLDKAAKAYETAQFIYDSMKSKSLIETVTFDDGLVGKIDSNISIDRLSHTRFGALAWDSSVKSGLNPNEHNDLHYVVKKSGNIVLDTFTGNGIRYYNKALTTRVGLFRWYDYVSAEDSGAVEGTNNRPNQYDINSDEYNVGWVYFTPTGGGKVITINPGVGKYIYRMWDTPFGIFMSVRNYRYYGLSAVEYWSFKQLIAIPTNDNKAISIDDSRYFADLNCNEIKIVDCCITQNGLFITGHSNNKYVTLRYNGDDFYVINDNEFPIVSIIDTTDGTYFFTDQDDGNVYEFDTETEKLQVSIRYNPNIGNLQIAGKFGQRRTDVETVYGPQIVAKGGIYNLGYHKKTAFDNSAGNGPTSLQKIRIYVNNEKDNLPVIAEYLASKGLPMDEDIKCIGSIMCNGLQVLINGLHIISENGISRKPLTVKFFIDKNARFTRNQESVEALLGSDPDKWDKDIGVISDYDSEIGEYYDIPYQISKMNFIVLFEEFNNYNTSDSERFIVKRITITEYKVEEYVTEDTDVSGYEVPAGWILRRSELTGIDDPSVTLFSPDSFTYSKSNMPATAPFYGLTFDYDPNKTVNEMLRVMQEYPKELRDGDTDGNYINNFLKIFSTSKVSNNSYKTKWKSYSTPGLRFLKSLFNVHNIFMTRDDTIYSVKNSSGLDRYFSDLYEFKLVPKMIGSEIVTLYLERSIINFNGYKNYLTSDITIPNLTTCKQLECDKNGIYKSPDCDGFTLTSFKAFDSSNLPQGINCLGFKNPYDLPDLSYLEITDKFSKETKKLKLIGISFTDMIPNNESSINNNFSISYIYENGYVLNYVDITNVDNNDTGKNGTWLTVGPKVSNLFKLPKIYLASSDVTYTSATDPTTYTDIESDDYNPTHVYSISVSVPSLNDNNSISIGALRDAEDKSVEENGGDVTELLSSDVISNIQNSNTYKTLRFSTKLFDSDLGNIIIPYKNNESKSIDNLFSFSDESSEFNLKNIISQNKFSEIIVDYRSGKRLDKYYDTVNNNTFLYANNLFATRETIDLESTSAAETGTVTRLWGVRIFKYEKGIQYKNNMYLSKAQYKKIKY